jgi:hypothetical protein
MSKVYITSLDYLSPLWSAYITLRLCKIYLALIHCVDWRNEVDTKHRVFRHQCIARVFSSFGKCLDEAGRRSSPVFSCLLQFKDCNL